jgi:hypothetical protein
VALDEDRTQGESGHLTDHNALHIVYNDLLDSAVLNQVTRPSTETAHTDDDEFDGTGLGGWTTLTVSGTATWTEANRTASVVADNQTSGDMAAITKAITTASAPMTIQTSIQWVALESATTPIVGMFFANGATAVDNTVALWLGGVQNAETAIQMYNGTYTGIQADPLAVDGALFTGTATFPGLRLIWSAANTWKFQISPSGADGSWTDFEGPGRTR